jgi:hypothetical protein
VEYPRSTDCEFFMLVISNSNKFLRNSKIHCLHYQLLKDKIDLVGGQTPGGHEAA